MSVKLKNSSFILNAIKILVLLALIVVSFIIFFSSRTFSNILTEDEYLNYDIWDGVAVANDFSGGNGSLENPYQISSASEFMYFKSLVEGEDSNLYNSSYYILTNSINFNDNELISIGVSRDKSFKGHFDGNGYSVAKVKLVEQMIDGQYYAGLFSFIDGATIQNINIKEFGYSSDNESFSNVGVIAGYANNSKVENCGVYDSVLTVKKGYVGGILGYQSGSSSISNCYINATTSGGGYDGSVVGYSDVSISTSIKNIVVYDNDDQNLYGSSKSFDTYENVYSYSYKNDKYTVSEYYYSKDEYKKKNIDLNTEALSTLLTNGNNEKFSWYVDREYIRFDNLSNVMMYKASVAYALPNASILLHDSGVEGDTIYVNDLETSWNYYMGLNYTDSDGTLPSNENKNIYNISNLVPVYYNFNGMDINDSSKVGYISLNEQQSNYTYYKYYPVVDGYVVIELVDNPFSDRPDNMGFNGWVTSYSGATITYDSNYHTSYVKIPVTYTDGVPESIQIEFNAVWIEASIYNIASTSNEWNSAFDNLDNAGMKVVVGREDIYESVGNYYIEGTASFFGSYPSGAVNSSGNSVSGRCWTSSGCTYYQKVQNDDYDPSVTYYELLNGKMTVHQVQVVETKVVNNLPKIDHFNLAGYYREVNLSQNDSLVGYYDVNGKYQSNGVCSLSECIYYELVQFYDSDGNISTINEDDNYYYLVTRDTNIIVMAANQSSTWSSTNTKPFTLTSVHNGVDYRSSVTWNTSGLVVNCYADTTIENIVITSGQTKATGESLPGSGTSTSRYIFGRWNNLKLGRGIKQSSNNTNFNYVIGGYSSSTGSSSDITKYRLIVESGLYNSISMSAGAVGTSYTNYIEAKAIYGNDYDRVLNNHNNLEVAFNVSGSYGGVYYASDSTGISFDANVKSGKFGTNKYDYTTGIYVGGRNGGTHNSARKILFEGGETYNLIGGPLTNSNRYNYNDSYIYVTGGSVDVIIGGAGTTATYGNRIVQVTGGTVNYSLFGGSNGYQGSSSDGTVRGTSYVYVGGNATIGDATKVNSSDTLWGAEAGSVFGIGNGRSGRSYTSVGSSDNSIIVIDGSATINNNVYGGGNYGATGVNSNSNTTETNILIAGGSIKGSVYGGGNNNGSGSTSKESIVTINMTGGTIEGSIYGGSNQIGTIYGDTKVNVIGGVVSNVYGGGQGGNTGSSSTGTYVKGNVDVVIGNRSYDSSPVIKNNVYGGSAYGVVNGTTVNNDVSSSLTSVTVNDGVIAGSVYGGNQGSSSITPYVLGNTAVTINGGKINSVYGGNETAGSTNGTITVNLNGGVINDVYGGGKNVDETTADVKLNGAIVDNIYGGGHAASLESNNVTLNSGSVLNVYGGSNQSGDVGLSNITSSNTVSNIKSELFVDVNVTGNPVYDWETVDYQAYETLNVSIKNNSDVDIVKWQVSLTTTNSVLDYNYSATNVYENNSVYTFDEQGRWYGTNSVPAGGSYDFSFGLKSYVAYDDFKIISIKITGYDSSGNEYNSTTGGLVVGTIYGGNNAGGTTGSTNVIVDSTSLKNIYGGGNNAVVTENTSVQLLNSNLSGSIFGGGNAGNVAGDASVVVQNSNIGGSIYGGGNSADVYGKTDVTVNGNTAIGESIYGGGNSGSIGSTSKNSKTVVNVVGATVEKNVYGGCNTAVVYGTTEVNIGTSTNKSNNQSDILIKGTVFGGGEANAQGSEIYDYTFISVTGGIDINIDGSSYKDNKINLQGSIFGSGNASSSSGESNIYISNLGTKLSPNKAVSIQRATNVVISDSVIELQGTTDRTNEYSTIKYSLNRIKLLKIKNNTRLLLQHNANLLEEVQSLVDVDNKEIKASVTIDKDGMVKKNTDNRIYLLANKNLNVATNEAATSYGKVSGMSFLGMYLAYDNGSYSYGIYDMNSGDSADAGDVIIGGSYVLGLHPLNADTTIDGFYSNYINDDYTQVSSSYIEPTPSNANYYIWAIGIDAVNYSFDLTASKYSSLGTYELSLIDFPQGNTIFQVMGFNAEGLSSGVSLVDANDVPKIGTTSEEANSVLGLSLKAETPEWTSHGTTKFLSKDGGSYKGYNSYLTDNQNTAPSLTFYLYHAKNISLDSDLGTVVISLQALTPVNDIEYEISLITVTIDLSAKTYSDEDAYDASITYGKKYEMPYSTDVNITSDGSFTAYYSLYAEADNLESVYGNNNGNYHTLSSSYVLPVGTKITMLDLSVEDSIKYYYYIVNEDVYNQKLAQYSSDGEATYNLSSFIAMDSVSVDNRYNDSVANKSYYHSDSKLIMEEFLFIFDFEDSNITGNHLDNSIILELRTPEDRTSISVLGIRQELMNYNLYEVTNVVLKSEITLDDKYLYQQTEKQIDYDVKVGYDQTTSRNSIIDTRYESNSMGINISILDSSNNIVSSSMLVGTSIRIDNNNFYPSSDGVFRIKLADKVANISKKMYLVPGNALPSGNYKMNIELFSSTDGLHVSNGVDTNDVIDVTVVGTNNSIQAITDSNTNVIDGHTGLNLNSENYISTTIKYVSVLSNPNIRLSVYRKSKDSYNTFLYEEVDLATLSSTTFTFPAAFGYKGQTLYEYIISNNPENIIDYKIKLKENIISGTYKLVFKLYDNNQLIDLDEEYIIVKKNTR